MDRLASALAAYQAGRLDDAERLAGALLHDHPTEANAWFLLGLIERRRGRADAAALLVRRAIALEPRHAVAWKMLGSLSLADAAPAKADPFFRWSLILEPGMADALIERAQVLLAIGAAAEAVDLLRAAAALLPEHGAPYALLGKALAACADTGRAEVCLRWAMHIGSAEGYFTYGTLLAQQSRFEEALACFRHVVALQADFAAAWLHRGLTAFSLSLFDEATVALEQAARLAPQLRRDAMIVLAAVHSDCGRPAEARAIELAMLAEWPGDAGLYHNLLLRRVYDETVSGEQLLAEHRAYAAALPPVPPPLFANRADPERRLRLGYVSADFRRHPVAYFLEGILAAHDREAVEVFCYSDTVAEDDLTGRLRGLADHWRHIAGLADDVLERLIRDDAIDVLVDLAGHTAGNRLAVFARKAAPVQVSWMGYLSTTGLAAIDGVIACPALIPPDEDRWYAEKVIRLSGMSMCYRPPEPVPDPAPAPVIGTGAVTFGCFNNPLKIRPPVVAVWSRILAAVPTARLALKYRNFNDATVRDEWRARFAAHGIAGERIGFAGGSKYPGYMAAYGGVDIALDPFPYNGGTTTAEALWMGVPVIALRGNRYASRIATAMLDAVGRGDFIADSVDDYVAKAVALAGDHGRLATLRPELRRAVLASRLARAEPVTRDLEAALRELWRSWCERFGSHSHVTRDR